MSGNEPGCRETSPTRTSTRPGSTTSDAIRAGPLDGGPQVRLGHGAEEVETALDKAGELGKRGEVGHVVGAQGQDHLSLREPGHEPVHERAALRVVHAQREQLLALVDDKHAPDSTPCPRGERPPAGDSQA